MKIQLGNTNKLINEIPSFEFIEKNKCKNEKLFDKLDKPKIDEVKEIRINIFKETKDEIIPLDLENKNNEINSYNKLEENINKDKNNQEQNNNEIPKEEDIQKKVNKKKKEEREEISINNKKIEIENQKEISKENHIDNDIKLQDNNIFSLKENDNEIKNKNDRNLSQYEIIDEKKIMTTIKLKI